MSTDIELWKLFQRNAIKLPGTPWTLVGYSVAARRTALYIPELGIAFDCGLPTEIRLAVIFLSHCHYDHVRELPSFLLIKPSENVPPITLVLPGTSVEFVVPFVTSTIQMTKMTKMRKENKPLNWKVIPAFMQKEQMASSYLPEPMIINNMKFIIELFKCTHSITCTGYGLIESRTKLQQKYKKPDGSVDQEEISELKKQGVNVCEEQQYFHVCFLGDTDHRVFYLDKACTQYNPRIEKYTTIIVECTFLGDDKEKTAKEKKHMLWKNLRRYIEVHSTITFILYHFSMCYLPSQIIEFFRKENLPNVIPLVHDFDIVPKLGTLQMSSPNKSMIRVGDDICKGPPSIDSNWSLSEYPSTENVSQMMFQEKDDCCDCCDSCDDD